MKIHLKHALIPQALSPRLVVLVTSVDREGRPNIIPLSWVMPTSFEPPLIAISVGIKRFSHNLIESSGEFVVNLPTRHLLNEVMFCGSHSGKSVNKFKETGLTPLKSEKVKPPRIKECVAHLECKLVNKLRTGDHTIFVGEVIASSCDEEVFDEKLNILNLNRVKPLYHRGGPSLRYFATIGEVFEAK